MTLIDDWHKCWKLLSVQANAIGSAAAVGYASMYEQLKETFPPQWMAALTAAIFALGIVGRVVSQQKPDDPK